MTSPGLSVLLSQPPTRASMAGLLASQLQFSISPFSFFTSREISVWGLMNWKLVTVPLTDTTLSVMRQERHRNKKNSEGYGQKQQQGFHFLNLLKKEDQVESLPGNGLQSSRRRICPVSLCRCFIDRRWPN